MKIAILFARLGPYHHARLRASSNHCDLTAIEISAVDRTYAWKMVSGAEGFKRVTLFTDSDLGEKSPVEVRKALWRALDNCKPEVVAIPGWATVPALLALEWCHRKNTPAILMSDSQEIDEPRVWWKEFIKARVVKQFGVGFVAGSRHKDYLKLLGLPHEQVFSGYDVVDNGHFAEGAGRVQCDGQKHRTELALPKNYFLKSSRFVAKKNLLWLIDVFAQYSEYEGANAWDLVIIGDGPLRPQLEKNIKELKLTARVHLPGFKQYEELPVYYGLAGAYIQASTTEQWGLAVNEAMASGLPVLVSNRCGCAPDLVQEGINGYSFDPTNVDGMAELMIKISKDQSNLEEMGHASREIIAHWTPDTFAENLLKAAETAMTQAVPKASWLDRVILKGLIYR